jgi:hypothetical protein
LTGRFAVSAFFHLLGIRYQPREKILLNGSFAMIKVFGTVGDKFNLGVFVPEIVSPTFFYPRLLIRIFGEWYPYSFVVRFRFTKSRPPTYARDGSAQFELYLLVRFNYELKIT